ncbi:MAG: methyltransferase domain-containing protein [Bdellovibrio sp.]|nr:methyltransferase domain-containing protein [Bdellovibrio sp.]
MPLVAYHSSKTAHENYTRFLTDYIIKNQLRNICEVGGGSNPSLSLKFIQDNNIQYTLLDVSQDELNKASDDFHKIRTDIVSSDIRSLTSKFDFIFTKMVAEHVSDDEIFHKNIYHLLEKGGHAFHFIPTLWAPPYIANLLIPEKLAYKVLLWIDPNRAEAGHFRKFPAYYKGCRGPTKGQIKKLASYGYNVMEYIGFFGHAYYYQKIKPLKWLHEKLASFLIQHPIAWLTSYAYITLQKPLETSRQSR